MKPTLGFVLRPPLIVIGLLVAGALVGYGFYKVQSLGQIPIFDNSYTKKADGIYFDNHADVGGYIVGADPMTFQVLPSASHAGSFGEGDEFAKDANHVYFDLDTLPKADPMTFVVLNARYGKDTHAVYLMNEIVNGADPATFTVFDENVWFGKDATRVYTKSKVIPGADPKTFTLCVDNCYLSDGTFYNASDKNHTYFYEKVVQ